MNQIAFPDPALFSGGFQDANKKFFCLLLTVGTFTAIFKDNELSKVHKTVEIKGFLHFFCLFMEGSGSDFVQTGSGRLKNIWILRIRNTADYRKKFLRRNKWSKVHILCHIIYYKFLGRWYFYSLQKSPSPMSISTVVPSLGIAFSEILKLYLFLLQ